MIYKGYIPKWIQDLFPSILFRIEDSEYVYLTFDDGPDPDATPQILDFLDAKGWKATFFLLGSNAIAHPELLERIQKEGHLIANHGYDHIDGWKVRSKEFWQNAQKGVEILGTQLFRPPYGHISIAAYRKRPKDMTIVLWDVLSWDFDLKVNRKERRKILESHTRAGSILVFHDTKKCLTAALESLQDLDEILAKKNLKIRRMP